MADWFPILLAIHAVLAAALIGIILLQPSSSGDGLSSSASPTFAGMMTSSGSKTFLTRLTALLAAIFMVASLGLTIFLQQTDKRAPSIADEIISTTPSVPNAETPAVAPTVPEAQ